nr:hypothetical protein [uncultured Mediterraneibacter sp.]
MEWIIEEERRVAGSALQVSAAKIGEDILLCVSGGTKPHIGCVVQAVPRLSLSGDGTQSATASVLNLTGHKDEFLCRKLAEIVCSRLGVTVVCTGGFHLDGMTDGQIRELLAVTEDIGEKFAKQMLRR